jgi:hypothetical protein
LTAASRIGVAAVSVVSGLATSVDLVRSLWATPIAVRRVKRLESRYQAGNRGGRWKISSFRSEVGVL